MKKTNVDNIFKYLSGAKYLGTGSTAICFLLKDSRVLKLYVLSFNKHDLFCCYRNMAKHLEDINSIGNDTYKVPEEILYKNGKVIGYISEYAKGRIIKKINNDYQVDEILTAYDKLVNDTRYISDRHFYLNDVHGGNVTFDGKSFNVFDLDWGRIETKDTIDVLLSDNMGFLNKTIIGAMFGIDIYKNDIIFLNEELNDLYRIVTYRKYEEFDKFIKCLKKDLKMNNPTILDLKLNRGKTLIYDEHTDYYQRTL